MLPHLAQSLPPYFPSHCCLSKATTVHNFPKSASLLAWIGENRSLQEKHSATLISNPQVSAEVQGEEEGVPGKCWMGWCPYLWGWLTSMESSMYSHQNHSLKKHIQNGASDDFPSALKSTFPTLLLI